jgi:hypothetical protein
MFLTLALHIIKINIFFITRMRVSGMFERHALRLEKIAALNVENTRKFSQCISYRDNNQLPA